MHERIEARAASCRGNVREDMGGSEQPQTRPAAGSGSEFCDFCGGLTSDPRVIDGKVMCGVCAREERLQDHDPERCTHPNCRLDY